MQNEDPNVNKVNEEEINNINSRLKEVYLFIKENQNIPKTVFAKNIGMTSSFQLQKIWDNKNLVSSRNLFLLEKHFHININWILSGNGKMLLSDIDDEYNQKISNLEQDKNECLKALNAQGIELNELKKKYDSLFILIEKLNEGGVFNIKLEEISKK